MKGGSPARWTGSLSASPAAGTTAPTDTPSQVTRLISAGAPGPSPACEQQAQRADTAARPQLHDVQVHDLRGGGGTCATNVGDQQQQRHDHTPPSPRHSPSCRPGTPPAASQRALDVTAVLAFAASDTPKPNRPGAITPNVEYAATNNALHRRSWSAPGDAEHKVEDRRNSASATRAGVAHERSIRCCSFLQEAPSTRARGIALAAGRSDRIDRSGTVFISFLAQEATASSGVISVKASARPAAQLERGQRGVERQQRRTTASACSVLMHRRSPSSVPRPPSGHSVNRSATTSCCNARASWTRARAAHPRCLR